MKKLPVILLIILLFGCKGVWLTQTTYRPKHPRFSILKKPFKPNTLIYNASLYLSIKNFITAKGDRTIGYMGFYADGRMIIDNTYEKDMDQVLNKRNSFKTAISIGYYTTKDSTIEMQFFVPTDGGLYDFADGIIRKDTIILIQKPQLFSNKITYRDTLVKSAFVLLDN